MPPPETAAKISVCICAAPGGGRVPDLGKAKNGNHPFTFFESGNQVILFLDKKLKKFFIAALHAAAPAVPPGKVLTTFLAAAPVGPPVAALALKESLCDSSRPGRILRPHKTIASFYEELGLV